MLTTSFVQIITRKLRLPYWHASVLRKVTWSGNSVDGGRRCACEMLRFSGWVVRFLVGFARKCWLRSWYCGTWQPEGYLDGTTELIRRVHVYGSVAKCAISASARAALEWVHKYLACPNSLAVRNQNSLTTVCSVSTNSRERSSLLFCGAGSHFELQQCAL